MYEYHGWITIRESPSCDSEEDGLQNVISTIREYIDLLEWPTGLLDLRSVNGDFHLNISGLDNHKALGKYDPVEIFIYVGRSAPGSYGILYTRDCNNDSNEFHVHVLKRGELEEKIDHYLSPFIPSVEDDSEL